jgi:hypothetical protein
MELGGADAVTGETYCDCDGGGSREAGEGPPNIDEIDMLSLPLVGRPKEGNDGSSRLDGKALGGPTDTGGARGGRGP